MSGFLAPLQFHLVPGRELLVELDAPLIYESKAGWIYTVPLGFWCDLASIPRLARSFATSWHLTARAGVLHDLLYRWAEAFGLLRREADGLYREALRSDGVGRIRARIQWLGLRAFGWVAWRKWRAKSDSHADKGIEPLLPQPV